MAGSLVQTALVQQVEGAFIKCAVIGDRPLHISWKRNGLSLGGRQNGLDIEQQARFSVSPNFG